jgi:hypothetical protein
MTPIQQLFLGVGAKKRTYLEDVFSNYVYRGNATARSINTGIDLSSKGGLVWTKNRDQATSHRLFDTERGVNKEIRSNSNNAEATDVGTVTAFNNNGFSLGTDDGTNWDTKDYASWTFRKAKGFFDVVTYTGNDTNRSIAHSLGCVPGFMMIKRTDDTGHWRCYHKDLGPTKHVLLSSTGAETTGSNSWNDTAPTASVFSLGTATELNNNGSTYVAYLFAGGESTAATARSVDFDGSDDRLMFGASSDFSFGTGDFTVEGWFKQDGSSSSSVISLGSHGSSSDKMTSWDLMWDNTGEIVFYGSDAYRINSAPANSSPKGQWHHFALVRHSGVCKLYYNGNLAGSYTSSEQWGAGNSNIITIGGIIWDGSYSQDWNGKISNIRIVKGTAVYTSSFKPPTEPLTNITNTVLLCCNNSSVTGGTVLPVTPTTNSSPTASTDSPFDDPAGFVFGDAGDQNVIKCGSITTDSSNGATLHLPWEPQWFLFKRTDASSNWTILDSMRGWTTDGTVQILSPNLSNAESGGGGYEELKARTIKFQGYGNNYNFIWIAIRRPDGYVGKPPELGTDVFAMDTGGSSSIIPNYDSGFPVDFGLRRRPAATEDWTTLARLIQGRYVVANNTDAGTNWAYATFDSNVGFLKDNDDNTYQAWMWKRHAGFDVVCYTGTGVNNLQVPHGLNAVPEMMWVKNRTSANDWIVYHKGLNGGTNPQNYFIVLNSTSAEADNHTRWNDTAPTSSIFTLGDHVVVNEDDSDHIAMLFASVDSISKCGYWTGDGTSNDSKAITTGFNPRFVLIKRASNTGNWLVIDTVRGFTKYLRLNLNLAEDTQTFITATSTGFTISSSDSDVNANGDKYIYYAHA